MTRAQATWSVKRKISIVEPEIIEHLEPCESPVLFKKQLSDEKKKELIALLVNQPWLWDNARVKYKNRQIRTAALDSLSESFNIDNDTVKKYFTACELV